MDRRARCQHVAAELHRKAPQKEGHGTSPRRSASSDTVRSGCDARTMAAATELSPVRPCVCRPVDCVRGGTADPVGGGCPVAGRLCWRRLTCGAAIAVRGWPRAVRVGGHRHMAGPPSPSMTAHCHARGAPPPQARQPLLQPVTGCAAIRGSRDAASARSRRARSRTTPSHDVPREVPPASTATLSYLAPR
jgi:hypothetical protein